MWSYKQSHNLTRRLEITENNLWAQNRAKRFATMGRRTRALWLGDETGLSSLPNTASKTHSSKLITENTVFTVSTINKDTQSSTSDRWQLKQKGPQSPGQEWVSRQSYAQRQIL